MEQVVDLALPEYFERISAEATFQEQLSVIDIDNSRRSPVQVKNYPIRLKGYSLIFVLSGGKRLRDSILSPLFHSYIFAMYKNEALWI